MLMYLHCNIKCLRGLVAHIRARGNLVKCCCLPKKKRVCDSRRLFVNQNNLVNKKDTILVKLSENVDVEPEMMLKLWRRFGFQWDFDL